eukprot:6455218-Amphidinium_carterae.1
MSVVDAQAGELSVVDAQAGELSIVDAQAHDLLKHERKIRFREPEVEQLIEFEVESITVSTALNARNLRCLGKKRSLSLAQVDPASLRNIADGATAQAVAVSTRTMSRKRREAQALNEMPTGEGVTLSKAVPISAEAVRQTAGKERELWRDALRSELNSLEDNRVFYKVTADRARELQQAGASSVLARLVLVLKPEDNGFKRKARIVACGNFIGLYESYDVSNLDAAIFRTVLQITARRKFRVGVVDIRTAFLNAGIEPGRTVIVRPPGLLRDFDLQGQ